MANRFWVARAARGTMKIEGLVGVFATEVEAIEARVELQGNTQAGLSGDIFVVIDAAHLPQRPDVPLPDVNVDHVYSS